MTVRTFMTTDPRRVCGPDVCICNEHEITKEEPSEETWGDLPRPLEVSRLLDPNVFGQNAAKTLLSTTTTGASSAPLTAA